MNRPIRRISLGVVAMFLALFMAATYTQVIDHDALRRNPHNTRTLLQSYNTQRGAILVNGTPVALSEPVDTEYKYQRKYPQGELYGAVTGYFTHTQGSTGIEDAMNGELSGTSDSQFFEGISALFTGRKPAGATVQLTLDAKVQQAAWDALGDRPGAVIAMDPKTGRILALVSKPTFDPGQVAVPDNAAMLKRYRELEQDPAKPLDNRAIGGNLNPPGSVFKLVVAAAALENGIATPDSPLPNPETWTLPGSTAVVNNPNHGAKCGEGETTNIRIALQYSCNIPFAQLAIQLGSAKLRAQAEKFGFNRSFNIPLASTPSTYPTTAIDAAQTALTGFGQFDVRATPLQITMVTAAIMNRGKVMQPQLVDEVLSTTLSRIQGPKTDTVGQAMSEKNANDLRAMMVNDVANGVASNAKIDGVDVAGKTGTAENGPGEPYSLWFTGAAESGDSRVAVTVLLENGGGHGEQGVGSGLATTIGHDVMKAVLHR